MDPGLQAHLHDWLNLLLRWAHFITGVAWIGASFYFNWLENHLERQLKTEGAGEDIAGDLWAVHGGGFYYLQKFEVAPPKLPATLHWFKYEAYFTWITGFALLCSLYYMNAGVYMVDRTVSDISATSAVALGIASLVLSWLFYDILCKSPLRKHGLATGAIIFAWFAALAWFLSDQLSGRAAYIHVGAAIGTIMVANVFFGIIPAQKELVAAVKEGRTPEASKGKDALLRSRHNNYFTLPVLFIMISNHYSTTYSNSLNWLVLIVVALAGIGVRHYFNVRHFDKKNLWVLPIAFVLLAVAIYMTRPVVRVPAPVGSGETAEGVEQLVTGPTTAEILPLIHARCSGCHSESPTLLGFTAPVMGLALDTEGQLNTQAYRVYQTTVVARNMPFGNMTEMTDEERDMVARWYEGRVANNE
ncbi:MAG TPA: urate hydroxylase PuuD [Xanthomonadales bacterium]|nr:urate hydroxylase PuuD [Xanthomonadales bacterium]